MGIVHDLGIILGSYSEGYRLMRSKAHGRSYLNRSAGEASKRLERASQAAIRVTLSRLKKKGFVENSSALWKLTQRGRNIWLPRLVNPPKHSKTTPNKKAKTIIVIFDIPEKEKWKRNWLRAELLALGFEKLQKSVWFGPAPLPDTFTESITELELIPHLKFFEARETDII